HMIVLASCSLLRLLDDALPILMQPLAGRSLRYWPAVLPRFAPLQERPAASAHALRSAGTERDEAGRLQYVALTRARDVTVLSGQHRKSTRLNSSHVSISYAVFC